MSNLPPQPPKPNDGRLSHATDMVNEEQTMLLTPGPRPGPATPPPGAPPVNVSEEQTVIQPSIYGAKTVLNPAPPTAIERTAPPTTIDRTPPPQPAPNPAAAPRMPKSHLADDSYVPFADVSQEKTQMLSSMPPATIPAPMPAGPRASETVRDDDPLAALGPVPDSTRVLGPSETQATKPPPGVRRMDQPQEREVDVNVQPTAITRPKTAHPPAAGGSSPSASPAGAEDPTIHRAVTRVSQTIDPNDSLIGRTIGGYEVKKKLGQGGMGAVYLARQVSLDRDVALKVLPSQFAQNPDFLARFTREALSAGQLTHHNVVQVYDVGSQEDVHYISMEFVRGDNLGTMTKKDGKLAFEDAAGYVLQAARGLQYAHSRGIIHRDIKPDNIMVNEHGIVKIADMGLAKMNTVTERSVGIDNADAEALSREQNLSLTGANVAMGTPAYMAPEQGRDASKVDHRADQYSLGCTLYYLVAGKTPFSGRTTFEIISKHMSEPVQPIETIVKNVPPELSRIIKRMLAKTQEERYPSLREVIEELEIYMGLDSQKGPYTPREHHLELLEAESKAYYAVPGLKLRHAVKGFYVVMGLALLASVAASSYFGAAAVLGLMVLTPFFHFLINGFLAKDHLFRRVRSVFFGMTLRGWVQTIGGAVGGLVLLWFFGLLVPWISVAVVAAILAVVYQRLVTARIRRERTPHLDKVQEMLKTLRIRGVSEEALMEFVCRYTGLHWEEFFENLFGYEAMIIERGRWASREKVRPRKKFKTWRDPVARWVEEVEQARQRRRDEAAMAKAEKRRLKAGGMTEEQADAEAAKVAKAVVEQELKETVIVQNAGPSPVDLERIDKELAKMRSDRPGKAGLVFALARLAVGAVILVAGAAPIASQFGAPVPQFLQNMLTSVVYPLAPKLGSMGVLYYYAAAAAGLMLALTVFSRRVVLPIVMILGCALLMATQPIKQLSGQAGVPDPLFFYAGVLTVLVGFGLMVAAKIGGSKF